MVVLLFGCLGCYVVLVSQAWADESFVEDDDGAGFYILAAALVAPERRVAVRAGMRDLRGRHAGKLHWTDLKPQDRKLVAEYVAQLDAVRYVVVIATPVPLRRQERARRVCLERLLAELHTRGVTTLTLESRGRDHLDARDVRTAQQARHRLPRGTRFRVEHVRGDDEPLTWLCDVVAGACHEQRAGLGLYRAILADPMEEIEIISRC